MYRECGLTGIRWTEKTMSMMKSTETDSCESFLRDLPVHGIFDSDCSFSDAEKLYAASFFGLEKPVPDSIITPDELRNLVLKDFPSELFLISQAEHELLLKLIFFGGTMKLMSDDDFIAAAGFSSRLWIRAVSASDGTVEITMSKQLLTTAVLVLAGDKYRDCRELISEVDDSINRTLYLYGFMQVNGPLNHLKQVLSPVCGSVKVHLLKRFFRSSYNYTFSPDGTMLLIHPGLARIDFDASDYSLKNDAMVETDEDSLRAVISELEPQEQPLYDQMNAVVRNLVRPEIQAEDAVEDLIMLAKQNVSESEMLQVLSDLVSGIPSDAMKINLHNIHERIPRWIFLSSSRLQ